MAFLFLCDLNTSLILCLYKVGTGRSCQVSASLDFAETVLFILQASPRVCCMALRSHHMSRCPRPIICRIGCAAESICHTRSNARGKVRCVALCLENSKHLMAFAIDNTVCVMSFVIYAHKHG